MLKTQSFSARTISLFLLLFGLCASMPQQTQAKTAASRKTNQAAPKPFRGKNTPTLVNHSSQTKEWNILVYFAGNNNLHRFVDLNISQMELIGSNNNINIIGHVDQFRGDELHRIVVHKGCSEKVWTLSNVPEAERINNPRRYTSGTQESLEDFLEWAIKTYPARKQCVIFWNHGSGIIDPPHWGRLITELHHNFFSLDQRTGKMVLNREGLLEQLKEQQKGVAFNDINGEYLTNQCLSNALENVRKKCLNGRRFDIVGMDACCMAQVELAAQVEDDADFFVASQEVELGAGWNYARALQKVANEKLSALDFSKEIVNAYAREYTPITDDYTLSVTDLHWRRNTPTKGGSAKSTQFSKLNRHINQLALILMKTIEGPESKKMRSAIRQARKKSTAFFDDNYIDAYHFVFELQEKGRQVLKQEKYFPERREFMRTTNKVLKYLSRSVSHFSSGKAYRGAPLPGRARGLSIYFPNHIVNLSYDKTKFAKTNCWIKFLRQYLR